MASGECAAWVGTGRWRSISLGASLLTSHRLLAPLKEPRELLLNSERGGGGESNRNTICKWGGTLHLYTVVASVAGRILAVGSGLCAHTMKQRASENVKRALAVSHGYLVAVGARGCGLQLYIA